MKRSDQMTLKTRIFVFCLIFLQIGLILSSGAPDRSLTVNEFSTNLPNFTFKEIAFIKYPLFTEPEIVYPNAPLRIILDIALNETIIDVKIYDSNNVFSLNFDTIVDDINMTIITASLSPNIESGLYSLFVNSTAGSDFSWHSVKILDKIPDQVSIVHITDTHIGIRGYNATRDLKTTVQIINMIKPDFVLLTGDMISGDIGPKNVTEITRRYNVALTILSNLTSPLFYVNGNHEDYAGMATWRKFFGTHYEYSFDYGDIHVTMAHSFGGRNLTWIKEDVESHSNMTRIVGYHWDFGDDFTNLKADYHVLGHEHRTYVEKKSLYTRIVTSKTYYGNENEPGTLRLLRFTNGELQENQVITFAVSIPESVINMFSSTTTQISSLPTGIGQNSTNVSLSNESTVSNPQTTSFDFSFLLLTVAVIGGIKKRRTKIQK